MMPQRKLAKQWIATGTLTLALATPTLAQQTLVDTDSNNSDNAIVTPPLQAALNRDQSLQNGGVLQGEAERDILQGALGQDTLIGNGGNDIMIGGTEHGAQPNRDRAFGNSGNDLFLWAPGDGSDFYDGGDGIDAIAFGLIGEVVDGQLAFPLDPVSGNPGTIFFDPDDGLPRMDVTNSPGFCTVVDASTTPETGDQLKALGLTRQAQFRIRGLDASFDGVNQTDNGLRVTIHLKDVEFVICATKQGGAFEVLDLRNEPPTTTTLEAAAEEIPGLLDIIR